MSTAKTNVPVVFGAMTFGDAGFELARTNDSATQSEILSLFQAHGHSEIDTARMYCNGTSEVHLGALQPSWQSRDILMDTKLFPRESAVCDEINTFDAAGIRLGLQRSLTALKATKIHMFYLHSPDRTVPFEETLKAVDDMYREGKFERFGVSNFMAWEVARICELCDRNGWIKPTAYQGVYSAYQRVIEPELIPCLRKYGIQLYAYSPLAGGVLTGRYKRQTTDFPEGGRYDEKTLIGRYFHARYLRDAWFDALELLAPVAEKHGLTIAECALRWMQHHSVMKPEFGDKIIIGAGTKQQLESNLLDMEKGPLPQDVVDALEAGWELTQGSAPRYYLLGSESAALRDRSKPVSTR